MAFGMPEPVALPEINIPASPAPNLRLPKTIGDAPALPQGVRLSDALSTSALPRQKNAATPRPAERGFGMPESKPRSAEAGVTEGIAPDQFPADTARFRKLSHAETVAMDGVECSYIDNKTGQIHPPWEHPRATPEARAAMLQTYRDAVARTGGAWNPYPNAAK